jgi:predicted TIM-barrel fold metal-dependent hydrolase
MRYDIHCHLFNKEVLSGWLRVFTAFIDLSNAIDKTRDMEAAADTKGLKDKMRRVATFLRIGMMSSEDIYNEMVKVYGDDFAVAPLMLDLTYAATAAEQQSIIDTFFKNDSLFGRIQEKAAGVISKITHDKEKEDLSEGIRDLENFYKGFKPHIKPFDDDGFESQIDQLTKLKKKHGKKVYPFLSVDPRRGDMVLDTVRAKVGPSKEFQGIKLYPALGFSPSDPLLMKPGGLYKYCQDNRIPITVHSSGGGFATLSNRIEGVSGFIYRKGGFAAGSYHLSHPEEVSKETVEFSEKLPNFGKMVDERAHIFNHPTIWRKVLEAYPQLYVNFAHLGGDDRFWGNEVLRLMAEFKNVYTDLSCWADKYRLEQLKLTVYDGLSDAIKNKVMFGSDFYVLMLFEDDFAWYYKAFTDIFGGEFDRIATENPKRFLFG